jgi:hypothetical protein
MPASDESVDVCAVAVMGECSCGAAVAADVDDEVTAAEVSAFAASAALFRVSGLAAMAGCGATLS